MKRSALILAVILVLLLFAACGSEPAVYTALEDIPEDYTVEQAKADGCVVHENGDISSGQEYWEQFLKDANRGKEASVRLANYYELGDPSRYGAEYYESIKDEYPKLFLTDLTYDGTQYTVRSIEDGEEYVRTYRYLLRYEGEAETQYATYDSYIRYVLTNDETVTWEELRAGMLSSQFGAYIEHRTVYTDYIGAQTEPVYTAGDVAGKIYTYEKEGCGGSFTIDLFADGTFQYYEGMLSSYIGMGTWTLDENNVLCLKDQEMYRFGEDFTTMEPYVRINYFKVEEDRLVWLAENSDNFLYVDVVDGEQFFGQPMEPDVSSYYRGAEGKTNQLITLDGVRFLMSLATGVTKEKLIGDFVDGFTCDDLVANWGEPDGMTSGIWSYAWELDETNSIWVVFDSEGYVSRIHFNTKE